MLLGAVAVGCGGPAEPLGHVGGTYVLSSVEDQTVAPFVTFDHVCNGHRLQETLVDTIILNADQSARRAYHTERLTDGVVIDGQYVTATGTWSTGGPQAATFPVHFNVDSVPLSYTMMAGAPDDTTVTIPGALGGSCPGSPNDGRNALLRFTRR